ncbi:MAG: DUF2889 domain-containing protein [Moorellales bacterium]
MADWSFPPSPSGELRIYHRQLVSGLWTRTDEELEVRVHRLDTWSEQAVSLIVGTRDFRIRHAVLAVHREAFGRAFGQREAPELCGLTAYRGAGKEFRRALAAWEEPELWVELLLEGIKALLQGEHCVFEARGYPSLEAYERYFRETFSGTCIYYALPAERVRPWPVYLADQVRDGCLFLRCRITRLSLGEGWVITSGLVDSYQELSLQLSLDPEGTVGRALAHTTRALDPACGRAASRANNLVGLKLEALDRRRLSELLAGPQGCTHLADQAAEAAALLRYARERT